MHLAITGGAGYIGSVVAELALAEGHTVVVIDNLQEGHRAAVPAGCRLIVANFADPAALEQALGERRVDAVLHLAAETTIEYSQTDPARYFANNLTRGLALLDAMRLHGVDRLIFSSTAATYGEPVDVPMTEAHPQRPINAYGESKLLFERCLEWYYRAYGLRSASFRYFNAAGATSERGEDHRHESHLIPLVFDAVLGRRGPVVVRGTDYPTSDGTCIRDYVHVIDIARAHLIALAALDRLGCAAYNIGSGTGHSVRDVIDTVGRVTGRTVPSTDGDRRPGDPARLVASADRLRRDLDWSPRYPTLGAIIESAWIWKLAHPEGYGD